MKANELKLGQLVKRYGSIGTVIGRTTRTVTIKFPISTHKSTFVKETNIEDLDLKLID